MAKRYAELKFIRIDLEEVDELIKVKESVRAQLKEANIEHADDMTPNDDKKEDKSNKDAFGQMCKNHEKRM